MNTFSLIKLFTLVGFLVLGRGAWAQDKKDEKTAKSNSSREPTKNITKGSIRSNTNCDDYRNKPQCIDWLEEFNIKKDDDEKQGKKDEREDAKIKDKAAVCKTSVNKYDELSGKSKLACSSFDQAGVSESNPGDQCTEAVAKCRKMIDGQFSPDAEGKSNSQILEALILKQANANVGPSTDPATNPASYCIRDPEDSKTRKQSEKDKQKQIDDLEKDIKKEAEAQAKATKDKEKEINKLKKEENEIIAENKKKANERGKKESDQTAEINKSVLEQSKRLRGYATAIKQEQQKMDTERQSFQSAMLGLTSERITLNCKQEFETAKYGIISAASGGKDLTPDQKAKFGSLISQCKGQVNCAAQMEGFLNVAKKACFESANAKVSEMTLGANQRMANIKAKIEEFEALIKDETIVANNNKAAIEDVKKNMSKEEEAENGDKVAKLAALNKDATNLINSTKAEIDISTQHSNLLLEKIKKLKLNSSFDAEGAYTDAAVMIDSAEKARVSAVQDCCEDNKDSKSAGICSRLAADKITLPTGGAKAPAGKKN